MRKFIKNSHHVIEAMVDKDVEIAEMEFVELIISFFEWKEKQKNHNGERLQKFVADLRNEGINISFLNKKEGSAPTLPIKEVIKHYTRI